MLSMAISRSPISSCQHIPTNVQRCNLDAPTPTLRAKKYTRIRTLYRWCKTNIATISSQPHGSRRCFAPVGAHPIEVRFCLARLGGSPIPCFSIGNSPNVNQVSPLYSHRCIEIGFKAQLSKQNSFGENPSRVDAPGASCLGVGDLRPTDMISSLATLALTQRHNF